MICDYLRLQYPDAIFRSDFASGMKLSIPQAAKHKRLQSSRAFPDIFIYEPRHQYWGAAIELKKTGTVIYNRDGSLRAGEHLSEQNAMLVALRERGYLADFCVGYEGAVAFIDYYLGTN